MEDCLFCKIAAGQIPSNKVYEDEDVFAFRDINPQTPVHILVIPKAHVSSVLESDKLPAGMCDKLMHTCAQIAKAEGLDNGYRVVNNCGEDGGQTVMHLHFHILGGLKLSEKIV